MEYSIVMKKDPVNETRLEKVRVPLGQAETDRKFRESEEEKFKSMIKEFLKKGEYTADSEKWSLNKKEVLIAKENPKVNSWKNKFGPEVFEEEFKIPDKRRKQFNKEVKQV